MSFDSICLIVGQVKQAIFLVDQIDDAFHNMAIPRHKQRHFAAENLRTGEFGVGPGVEKSAEYLMHLGFYCSSCGSKFRRQSSIDKATQLLIKVGRRAAKLPAL